MSSTDQIYHLAASRLGDKCDRSMTLGKLLGNNAVFHFYFLKPQYPILRFYAAVTFCLFGFLFLVFILFFFGGGGFWKKFVCPPPPHFLAPSYDTVNFSAHTAKARVHFCDHAQSIVLINPSSVPPSFWESFLLSSVKNLHFRLLVQNRLMDFRESWYRWSTHGPFKVLLFSGHIRPGVNPGASKK